MCVCMNDNRSSNGIKIDILEDNKKRGIFFLFPLNDIFYVHTVHRIKFLHFGSSINETFSLLSFN